MASLSHYNLVTYDCYDDGIYKFYKVFTDGTTCWKYTYCWEEEVYDAIKDLPVPVIYNDKDAKEHFKKLKTEKGRPQSALYTWTKRHNEILEICSGYEGGL
jgi:hypothetical protein